jgi:hypothetical protein
VLGGGPLVEVGGASVAEVRSTTCAELLEHAGNNNSTAAAPIHRRRRVNRPRPQAPPLPIRY